MQAMNRRIFLATTALSASRVMGANDRVRVALIGCGGRGRYVASLMKKSPNTEYAMTADCYDQNAEQARTELNAAAKPVKDFRRVLENKEVDAVHIATPDHWHANVMILACAAGKDIYVEKPLAHNIREGQGMVAAALKNPKLVVQVGTQHRSSPHFKEVQEIIKSGELGDVRFVRAWNYLNLSPKGLPILPDSEPPAGLDWDMYLGPAPKVPFNKTRFLGTYRYFWDYSGGYLTDFGIHRLDTVHQIMGAEIPTSVSAVGGRFTLKGAGDVPDTLQVTFEYKDFIVSYESSNLNGFGMGRSTPDHKVYNQLGAHDRPNGMAFYGTNGTIFADRVGYEVFAEPTSRGDQKPRISERHMNTKDATELHARNFIDCVRSRAIPNAPIVSGHRPTLIAHLGNIAYKTGHKLRWDGTSEHIADDSVAEKLTYRKSRVPWNLT